MRLFFRRISREKSKQSLRLHIYAFGPSRTPVPTILSLCKNGISLTYRRGLRTAGDAGPYSIVTLQKRQRRFWGRCHAYVTDTRRHLCPSPTDFASLLLPTQDGVSVTPPCGPSGTPVPTHYRFCKNDPACHPEWSEAESNCEAASPQCGDGISAGKRSMDRRGRRSLHYGISAFPLQLCKTR